MKPHTDPPPPPRDAAKHYRTRYEDGVVHHPHVDAHGHDDMHNEDVAHEHGDINVSAIAWAVVILLAVGVVAQIAMYLLFGVFERQAKANDPPVSAVAAPPVDMPATITQTPAFSQGVNGPQLLTNEPMSLEMQRENEQKTLHGYAWVNQGAGVAQIPIDQAKKLIAERGLPVREGEAAPPALGTHLPAYGEATSGRIITEAPSGPAAEPAPPAGQPAQDQAQPSQQPAGDAAPQKQAPAAAPHPGGGI
jgi:hypothetical protein